MSVGRRYLAPGAARRRELIASLVLKTCRVIDDIRHSMPPEAWLLPVYGWRISSPSARKTFLLGVRAADDADARHAAGTASLKGLIGRHYLWRYFSARHYTAR